ncbi:hypothetical protein [Tautonia sociabilis]|uniref:DUF2933 domain-containing protein n=1 Tax=Tautonia sociabilis TaxID=2080755 RepID=A0A432MI38_9BACT|nr:hypothetical protein [Tautonia sociabilis]RUL87034.1 hypothetical protein TsocGM_14675 [Tautonia sociabilis]
MDWSSLISLAAVGLMFFLMMRHGGGCCGGMGSHRPRGRDETAAGEPRPPGEGRPHEPGSSD